MFLNTYFICFLVGCKYTHNQKRFPFFDCESAPVAVAKRLVSLCGRAHLKYTEWQIYLMLSIFKETNALKNSDRFLVGYKVAIGITVSEILVSMSKIDVN